MNTNTPELYARQYTSMMLEKTIDTTVRGFVYEAHPDHPEGAETVRRMATYNEIPYAFIDAPREDNARFTAELTGATESLLSTGRG